MQLCNMFICECNIALHVSDAICIHLQEHLETVVTNKHTAKLHHVGSFYIY